MAAQDEERPARTLTGPWALLTWAACVAIALLVLKQVFWPFAKGVQFYLVIFLGLTLPLIFLTYRPARRPPSAAPPPPAHEPPANRGASAHSPSAAAQSRGAPAQDSNAATEIPGPITPGPSTTTTELSTAGTDTLPRPANADRLAKGRAPGGVAGDGDDTWRRFRCGRAGVDNPRPVDWALAAVSLLVGLYPVLPFGGGGFAGGYDAFLDRPQLSTADVVAGALLLVLVLEATRRTTGWVLPIVCVAFLAFAYYGGYLPQGWGIAHAGIDFPQIVNALFNEQSGFYGIPLDVAATYIVLFTIYGAVLNTSGAGSFFVDFSFAVFRRSRTAAGRTAAMSGFLLGTVSGSGTATTVSLGAITWPVLRKAGYPRENAGGLLAASGIGAILSPPTLGAAAFIIAEYLGTSYVDVLVWAVVPTALYYLGIILAVEADARRFGARRVDMHAPGVGAVLRQGGYHFASLGIIVVFLAMDIPPFTAVVYATGVAALFALVKRRGEPVRWAWELADSLAAGVRGALPVIAVCAAAGVITSTIAKTGLGLALAAALVDAAQALASDPRFVLALTAVFAAVAIGVLGLAVPVTASFIIAWVVLGPALTDLGVAPAETAMFIFYYAVLSEVTPPTALAAVAAAAITGGSVIKTMWQTWKYTLPAFLVPLAFVLTDKGSALLFQAPPGTVLWVAAVSAAGVAALAVVTGGWLLGPARWPERALCLPAALLLLYLDPVSIGVGLALFAAAVAVHLLTKERAHA